MNIQERVQEALKWFDELLGDGMSVEKAVAQAAEANEIPINVLQERVKPLGELEEHRRKMILRSARKRRQEGLKKREEELEDFKRKIRKASAARAEETYFANALNDPELAGHPSWPFYINRLIEELKISDRYLKNLVHHYFYAAVERLDTKYGTQTAHYQ